MNDIDKTFKQIHKTELRQYTHWLLFSLLVALTTVLTQHVATTFWLSGKGLHIGWYALVLMASAIASTLLWSWAFAFHQSFKYIEPVPGKPVPQEVFSENNIAFYYCTWPSWVVKIFAPAFFIFIRLLFSTTGSL